MCARDGCGDSILFHATGGQEQDYHCLRPDCSLADQADEDFAALELGEQATVQVTSPEVDEIPPQIREIFDDTIAEHPYDPPPAS